MIIKLRLYSALIILAVAGSSYCDVVTMLDPVITQSLSGDATTGFTSANWCTCQFLAVGGVLNIIGSRQGLVGVYQFDQTTESLTLTVTTTGEFIYSVEWCPLSCDVLAVGGGAANGGIIQIYNFISGMLQPVGIGTIQGTRINCLFR